jgi:hypothetical protein
MSILFCPVRRAHGMKIEPPLSPDCKELERGGPRMGDADRKVAGTSAAPASGTDAPTITTGRRLLRTAGLAALAIVVMQ